MKLSIAAENRALWFDGTTVFDDMATVGDR